MLLLGIALRPGDHGADLVFGRDGFFLRTADGYDAQERQEAAMERLHGGMWMRYGRLWPCYRPAGRSGDPQFGYNLYAPRAHCTI
jgi:hypothetical protein